MHEHTNEKVNVKVTSRKYLEDSVLYVISSRWLLYVSCTALMVSSHVSTIGAELHIVDAAWIVFLPAQL